VAGFCEYGDGSSGSGATELVNGHLVKSCPLILKSLSWVPIIFVLHISCNTCSKQIVVIYLE
jgi:hypothetical protein